MNLKYFDKHAQKTHPEELITGREYFIQYKTIDGKPKGFLKLEFVSMCSRYGRLVLKFLRRLKNFAETYEINWLDIEKWCAYPEGYEYLQTHEIDDVNRQCEKCGLYLIDIHANRIRCRHE